MSAILTGNSSPFPHVYVCMFAFRYLCAYLSVHPSIRGEGGGAWPVTGLEVEDSDTTERAHTHEYLWPILLSWLLCKWQTPTHQRPDETWTVGSSGKFPSQSGLNSPFLLWLALSPAAWPTPPSLACVASSCLQRIPRLPGSLLNSERSSYPHPPVLKLLLFGKV